MNYLGHVIQHDRPIISTKATEEIGGLEHPTNVPSLKSFPDPCDKFGRLAPNEAFIAALWNCELKLDQFYNFGRSRESGTEVLRSMDCCQYRRWQYWD